MLRALEKYYNSTYVYKYKIYTKGSKKEITELLKKHNYKWIDDDEFLELEYDHEILHVDIQLGELSFCKNNQCNTCFTQCRSLEITIAQLCTIIERNSKE